MRDWGTFALGTIAEADAPELRDALAARLADPDPRFAPHLPPLEMLAGTVLEAEGRIAHEKVAAAATP